MDFFVVKRRLSGKPLYGPALAGKGTRGTLEIAEHRVEPLNRMSRVARLVGAENKDLNGFAPLHDAVLIFARKDVWLLSGYELDTTQGSEVCFGQTWVMTPAPEQAYEDAMNKLTRELRERYPAPEPAGKNVCRHTIDLHMEVASFLSSLGHGSIDKGIVAAVKRLKGMPPAPPR